MTKINHIHASVIGICEPLYCIDRWSKFYAIILIGPDLHWLSQLDGTTRRLCCMNTWLGCSQLPQFQSAECGTLPLPPHIPQFF